MTENAVQLAIKHLLPRTFARPKSSALFYEKLATYVSPIVSVSSWDRTHKKHTFMASCSRITSNPNFITQDFFHFSSFIHNGDNLNISKNLNFHREFLKNSKFCTFWKIFSGFYVFTFKIVVILRNVGINHRGICKQGGIQWLRGPNLALFWPPPAHSGQT